MCGRDNPEHLVFCSECGHRLAPRVPPTAPANPPPTTSPLAATAPSAAAVAPPVSTGKPRPPAPQVSFSKRREAEASDATLPLERTASARDSVTCALCGTPNQRDLRFCITCGQLLAPSMGEGAADHLGAIELYRTAANTAVVEASAPPPAPAASPMEAASRIAPAPVIDVGSTAPRHDSRLCPRCRGVCDTDAQFCRFCGLALAGPAAASGPVAAPPPVTSRGVSPPAQVSLTNARLVMIARDGTEGPSYPLAASNDLGRLEGQILFADDPYISPRHARIVARSEAFFLRDLDSANGIFMRIPYRPASDEAARDAGADRDDQITIRGHHEDGPREARELPAEQPLGDQELFLVGQQVLMFDVVKEAEETFGPASENGTLLFGTPAAPRYARLSQRTIEGVVRDVFHVRRAETVIGRESGDIVFTDDPFLSRRHATLRMHAVAGGRRRRFTLADLGSSNGTFLRIREEVRLRHGDHFRIGQQLLRFDIDAAHAGV